MIADSPVQGKYPGKPSDSEADQEVLDKWAGGPAEAKAAKADEKDATTRTGGASRSDGFWTTFGKQVVRAVVPAATRMLEQSLKRGTRRGGGGGGFTGFGLTSESDQDDKPNKPKD